MALLMEALLVAVSLLIGSGAALNVELRSAAAGQAAPAESQLCLYKNKGVTCIDPHDGKQCTKGKARFPAITFTFDMMVAWKYDEDWCKKLRRMSDAMNSDLVLLLPKWDDETAKDFIPIPSKTMKYLQRYFRIKRVPWVIPPELSQHIPRTGGCCGAREFMKLNALGLTEYDAVINLDTDISIHGSLRPLFDCAASGRFLTARGSVSGVNGGMFVVHPSKDLLREVLADLRVSYASESDGWNGMGLAPGARYGQAGLQGFLYYFFYQRDHHRESSKPGQVDPCSWTGAVYCKVAACSVTPLRHKIRCPPGAEPPQI